MRGAHCTNMPCSCRCQVQAVNKLEQDTIIPRFQGSWLNVYEFFIYGLFYNIFQQIILQSVYFILSLRKTAVVGALSYTKPAPARSLDSVVPCSSSYLISQKNFGHRSDFERPTSRAKCNCGPGNSVGIATGYGLDSPEIESRWGARFSAPVQTGPGAHPPCCTMGTGSFPGVKSGRSVTLTPHPLSCCGHERVELYLYSLYRPYVLYRASVPVQGCTLPFSAAMQM